MIFEPQAYGGAVAEILALDASGARLMPLAQGTCSSAQARERIRDLDAATLFPHARAPQAARAGLFLYFSCWDEAHEVAQNVASADGSYWHAIVHRQEPDEGNSSYWFRRAGRHPVFPALREEAARMAPQRFGGDWDPFAFIDLCGKARAQPGSALESLALRIQRAEWQLLFDYCATPVHTGRK